MPSFVTGMPLLELEMKSFKRAKKLNRRPQLNSGKCTLNNFGTHLVYLAEFRVPRGCLPKFFVLFARFLIIV